MINPKALPALQRVSDTLKNSWIQPTGSALKDGRQYLSLNNPVGQQIRFLAIDCDHDDWSIPGHLPPPSCITITRDTGRHHKVWQLASPVSVSPNSRQAPQRLLAAVQQALTFHLDGDPAFTNTLTKSPFSDHWRIIDTQGDPVELHAFDDWLLEPGDLKKTRRETLECIGYGRNVAMFDHTRFWAYDHPDASYEKIQEVATKFNEQLETLLPWSEVCATSRSIYKFMQERYTGGSASICRQNGRIKPNQSPEDRMAIGAGYTHETRALSTKAKIKEALRVMEARGQKDNIAEVARLSGLTRPTVRRYLNDDMSS